ncbi:hypothetical protein J6590_025910 [Homalodisca vitripennis]|nr:hypothetical protein J6590_025910 [Homalodisca vitripennis]
MGGYKRICVIAGSPQPRPASWHQQLSTHAQKYAQMQSTAKTTIAPGLSTSLMKSNSFVTGNMFTSIRKKKNLNAVENKTITDFTTKKQHSTADCRKRQNIISHVYLRL